MFCASTPTKHRGRVEPEHNTVLQAIRTREMATYNPPAFPRRPKQSNPWSELRYQLQLNYYRYEINTALYVMSPGEKLAYNMIFLSFFILFVSAVYYYLPSAVYLFVRRLAYYFTGHGKLHVASTHAVKVVHISRRAIASLVDGGKGPNASLGSTP